MTDAERPTFEPKVQETKYLIDRVRELEAELSASNAASARLLARTLDLERQLTELRAEFQRFVGSLA